MIIIGAVLGVSVAGALILALDWVGVRRDGTVGIGVLTEEARREWRQGFEGVSHRGRFGRGVRRW